MGVSSAQDFLPLGRLNELEARGLEALKSELAGSIRKGVDFVRKGAPAPAPARSGEHGPSASPGQALPAAGNSEAKKSAGPGTEPAGSAGLVAGGAGTGSSSSVGGGSMLSRC